MKKGNRTKGKREEMEAFINTTPKEEREKGKWWMNM